MNPLVSIIIPVYNGANYMREAIDSALAQTYSNIEILVINDGSCDDGKTREIALSYGDKIRYFEKENGGVSTALNLGIREMEGDYFSWLSHDDLYVPEKIEKEINALENESDKTIPVNCGWALYYMNTGEKYIYKDSRERYSIDYFTNGTIATMLGLICGCGLLLHKSLFEEFGWFDETSRITQDYDMWFRMFRGKRILYVDEPLVITRVHGKQVTNTNSSFDEECDLINYYMIDNLNESDIESTGLSLYEFLCLPMLKCGNHGHKKAYHLVKEQLKKLEEPENAATKRLNLKNRIIQKYGDNIYLYCIGKRGLTLFDAFLFRGIDISGFSDSDTNKCNQIINGKKGVSIEVIPKEATIIVTKDRPYDLVQELRDKGFENVFTYNELEQLLMETPIDKDKLFNSN